MSGDALGEEYWLLRSCLWEVQEEVQEESWLLCSSGSASWRWEETQPLSEPVEPERQRDDEPELSVVMEGWLLVSCSCSSSSIQEVMKEPSAAGGEGRVWLYMCRLSGPSRLDEDGPDVVGSEVTAPRLKGLE